MTEKLPDIHFGEVADDEDFSIPEVEGIDDDDDEDLDSVSEDFIEILGFDPDELDDEVIQDAEWDESKHPRGQPDNPGQFAKSSVGASKGGVGEPISLTNAVKHPGSQA